jgi:hypothetical protein
MIINRDFWYKIDISNWTCSGKAVQDGDEFFTLKSQPWRGIVYEEAEKISGKMKFMADKTRIVNKTVLTRE